MTKYLHIDIKPSHQRLAITAEAYRLLKIIEAEFRSDPMSVQCFDLRIVEMVKRCIEDGNHLNKTLPDHLKL